VGGGAQPSLDYQGRRDHAPVTGGQRSPAGRAYAGAMGGVEINALDSGTREDLPGTGRPD
jgi:hypothetical protein